MPVPVPRLYKPPAHPVIKPSHSTDTHTNSFQNFAATLPVSPAGPPPSFGTREEWINSLPSWRRIKPRRIWEEDTRVAEQHFFHQGLTAADNASVIKGPHAEACSSPTYGNAASPRCHMDQPGSDGDADDEMDSDDPPTKPKQCGNGFKWESGYLNGPTAASGIKDLSSQQMEGSPSLVFTDLATSENQRGLFSPIFEDQSPSTTSGPDLTSSPLEPVTPFGDYVDRAVAATTYTGSSNYAINAVTVSEYECPDGNHVTDYYQAQPVFPTIANQPNEASAADVVTPSATAGYKKLAEPLSEWVANYVWKVCTTGLSLPSSFAHPMNAPVQYLAEPPSYLAPSVHSLLLSTLLQPSAIFLAIWYIVRLPVCFGAAALGPEYTKEHLFRAALLGEPGAYERENMEASAPFRLIVLGCMLANKWLDDHTFSNKTWHTISNVPIQALNRLESLTLDIFTYDLSISTRDWSQWLRHILSYHMSLSSPNHPQPISRPSANPHAIVRKAIDEIAQAPAAWLTSSIPQPVFLGVEERKREKLEQEQAIEALEIDLDKDGPLREEYLPRRRSNGVGNVIHAPEHWEHEPFGRKQQNQYRSEIMGKPLPPPAKWSPAGDEPILKERNRNSGQYVAVQPPPLISFSLMQHSYDMGFDPNWNPSGYMPIKSQPGYMYDAPPIHINQTMYPYALVPSIALPHSRSQSLSYDQHNLLSRNHLRSYSQSSFEYRCGDPRMTANELAPGLEAEHRWIESSHYPYPGPSFPLPAVAPQTTWLRT